MSQDCASHVLCAFGANLPNDGACPKNTILAAFGALDHHGLTVSRTSRLYATPSFPAGSGPDYVNAAAILTLRQALTAQQVLQVLHRIEAEFGRTRDARWAGRTLDIDLLAMGDSVLPDPVTQQAWRDLTLTDQMKLVPGQLILPHPRLQDRAFVLVPLAEVAPDWVHPLLGLSVAQMLARRPPDEVAQVVAMPDLLQ